MTSSRTDMGRLLYICAGHGRDNRERSDTSVPILGGFVCVESVYYFEDRKRTLFPREINTESREKKQRAEDLHEGRYGRRRGRPSYLGEKEESEQACLGL